MSKAREFIESLNEMDELFGLGGPSIGVEKGSHGNSVKIFDKKKPVDSVYFYPKGDNFKSKDGKVRDFPFMVYYSDKFANGKVVRSSTGDVKQLISLVKKAGSPSKLAAQFDVGRDQ